MVVRRMNAQGYASGQQQVRRLGADRVYPHERGVSSRVAPVYQESRV